MNTNKELVVEYGWDTRAGAWCGVIRGLIGDSAENLPVLCLKLRHRLSDTISPEATFIMKRTGPDKPRPP